MLPNRRMLKIERILCPVDFSEFSVRSRRMTTPSLSHNNTTGPSCFSSTSSSRWPSRIPTSLFRTRSISSTGTCAPMQKSSSRSLQSLMRATEPKSVVQEGLPIDSILSFASGNSVDLIVMATHGYCGLDRLAMGSVTEKILRKARCPVQVVRKPVNGFIQPPNGHDPVNLRKILFCTDFSENSDGALAYALSLALEYDSELTLLHVLEDLPNSTDLPAETGRVVRRLEAPIPARCSQLVHD
jgi:nucleotide-binding universal stress UspA family protein